MNLSLWQDLAHVVMQPHVEEYGLDPLLVEEYVGGQLMEL